MAIKFLNESFISRGRAYSFGWGAGAACVGGLLSWMLGLYYILLPIAEFNLLEEADYGSSDKFLSFEFIMLSFVWGVLSGVIFYRQVGYEVGRGLMSGSDMIAQDNPDHLFEINTIQDEILQQGNIVGQILSSTLTNVLDFVAISSTLCVIFPLLLVNSDEIQQGGEMAPYYWPGISLLISILIQLILTALTFIARGTEDEGQSQSPATFAAKQNLLQVILTKLSTMVVFAVVPLWIFPGDEFTFGEYNTPLYVDKVSTYSVIICSQVGMVTHAILIFLGEFFTSSAFKLTKEVSLEQMKGSGCGLSQAAKSASLGNGLILLFIGSSITVCYWFAGFFGVGCGLVGLINTPVLDLTIDFFAGASADGAIFAKLANIQDSQTRNIRNFARGAANYTSYIMVTNAAAIFYVNTILLGLCGYLATFTANDFINAEQLLGIFFGGCVAYMLKWSTNSSISRVSRSIRAGEILINNQDVHTHKLSFERDVEFQSQALRDFILAKFGGATTLRAVATIILLSFSILLLAWIWGPRMILGFIIGLNFIGAHITIYSILISCASSNARILNQEIQGQRDPHERHISGLQSSVNSDLGASTSESNGLIMYLLYSTLFVVMGMDQFWTHWGNYGSKFDEYRQDIKAPNDVE